MLKVPSSFAPLITHHTLYKTFYDKIPRGSLSPNWMVQVKDMSWMIGTSLRLVRSSSSSA